MLIDLLDRNVPALDCVTLLAVSAHLPFVDVSVAIRAVGTHIREDRLGVALGAAHSLVHAAQRILRRVVIEFRDGSNRLPSAERVAVLTGNTQTSVRATRVCGRLRLPACRLPARESRQCDHKVKKKCRSQGCPNLFSKGFRRETEDLNFPSKGMRTNSNPNALSA